MRSRRGAPCVRLDVAQWLCLVDLVVGRGWLGLIMSELFRREVLSSLHRR